MTAHPLRDFQTVPTRPGNACSGPHCNGAWRDVLLCHGVPDEGGRLGPPTHASDRGRVGRDRRHLDGSDKTVVVPTESVIRIPPGVPHAVRNDGRVEVRALAGAPLEPGHVLHGGDHVSRGHTARVSRRPGSYSAPGAARSGRGRFGSARGSSVGGAGAMVRGAGSARGGHGLTRLARVSNHVRTLERRCPTTRGGRPR